MAQTLIHAIADKSGPAVRADLNELFAALLTMHSGPTAPSPTARFMPWFDTSQNPPVLRFRNSADNAWVDYDMRAEGLGVDSLPTASTLDANTLKRIGRVAAGTAGAPLAGEAFSYFQLPGSAAANRIQIAIGETSGRMFWRVRAGSFNAWQEAAAVPATYESSEQTIVNAGLLTLAHGLGARPREVNLVLRCVTAQSPYAVGQEAPVASYQNPAGNMLGAWVRWDATNTFIRTAANGLALGADTGLPIAVTNSSWRYVVRAKL